MKHLSGAALSGRLLALTTNKAWLTCQGQTLQLIANIVINGCKRFIALDPGDKVLKLVTDKQEE